MNRFTLFSYMVIGFILVLTNNDGLVNASSRMKRATNDDIDCKCGVAGGAPKVECASAVDGYKKCSKKVGCGSSIDGMKKAWTCCPRVGEGDCKPGNVTHTDGTVWGCCCNNKCNGGSIQTLSGFLVIALTTIITFIYI